jgi:hypothetical protein
MNSDSATVKDGTTEHGKAVGNEEDREEEHHIPLPPEILRDIVELAARNDPATAARLEQTCFTFREWVGPILYDTVLLHSSSALIGFAFLLRLAPVDSSTPYSRVERSQGFYAKHVRYLSIQRVNIPSHIIEDIPRICTNVAIYETSLSLDVLRNYTLWPSLRQLIYNGNYPIPFHQNRWDNLTHLWLCSFSWDPFQIVTPPNLRYISVPLHINEIELSPNKLVVDMFFHKDLPRLELLVLDIFPPSSFLSAREVARVVPPASQIWDTVLKRCRDPRVVVRTHNDVPQHYDFVAEERKTGLSMWTRAVRDGIRHPDFKDEPPIVVEDP